MERGFSCLSGAKIGFSSNFKMGTQRAHTTNSISTSYDVLNFKMGTQRAHKGHTKGTHNMFFHNDLYSISI